MKTIYSHLALLFISLTIFSQDFSEAGLEEMINYYQSKIGTFITYEECGHIFDGPAYFMKEFENSGLDAMLSMTLEEELALGKQINQEILKTVLVAENHWAQSEVNKILNSLVKYVERTQINYSLCILLTPEINAFATVGGYLYVTTGLLDFIDTYDELAFIIGHEIAHVDRRHTQRKIAKISLYSSLLDIADQETFKNIALSINARLSAPFDQIDEYDADKHGVYFAKSAGYDVNRFADFFKKMEKYENRNLLNKLLSTHPFAEHRKNCIAEYISE